MLKLIYVPLSLKTGMKFTKDSTEISLKEAQDVELTEVEALIDKGWEIFHVSDIVIKSGDIAVYHMRKSNGNALRDADRKVTGIDGES